MKWLGIDIPSWMKNELIHSDNILERSIRISTMIAEELTHFCTEKKIPFGFNIESVSIRKSEIDASVELLENVKKLIS